jgi:protein disulfide-isomerase
MEPVNSNRLRGIAILITVLVVGALAFAAFRRSDSATAEAHGAWTTDLPAALAKAGAENKLVLMDFTGSDWCPPCKALFKNVFSTRAFLDYASAHLVLVEVDFPRGKEQTAALREANEALLKKFGVEGFPTVIVLDANGKELRKEAGYGGTTAAEFIAELQRLRP